MQVKSTHRTQLGQAEVKGHYQYFFRMTPRLWHGDVQLYHSIQNFSLCAPRPCLSTVHYYRYKFVLTEAHTFTSSTLNFISNILSFKVHHYFSLIPKPAVY